MVSKWDLDDDDVKAVEAVLGPGAIQNRTIEVTKTYKELSSFPVPVNEKAVVAFLLNEVACDQAERLQFGNCSRITELKAKVQEVASTASPRVKQLLERLNKFRDGSAYCAAIDVLYPRMPKFIYFSNYDRMAGTVHLDTLAQHEQNASLLTRSDQVVLAFLAYAGTSLSEILKLNTYEAIKARVEAASIKISRQIFEYWSQNRHLKVEFSVEPGRSGDPPPLNSGTVMRTRIHNKLHDMTVPFDDRSAGFTWFFSFLVWFSQVKKKFGNVVILLDEPGLNLHGKAQGDLVKFIYEKLRPNHQVIYTTHSPFMVPSADFSAVRTVEDVVVLNGAQPADVLGTKVGDHVLSSDPDTLFPLQGALGYKITQSLFIGKHTLVVEGPSDILYLQVFSAELQRRKRDGLDSRWTICPAGGVDKVAAFLSLFAGNKLQVAVLLDYAHGQKGKVETLKRLKLAQDGHVFATTDFCKQDEADVEDLLGRKLYISLINAAYEIPEKSQITEDDCRNSGEKLPRVVKQIEAVFRTRPNLPEFDHYFPAAWLLQHPEFLHGARAEVLTAADTFEEIFKSLNKLLPKV